MRRVRYVALFAFLLVGTGLALGLSQAYLSGNLQRVYSGRWGEINLQQVVPTEAQRSPMRVVVSRSVQQPISSRSIARDRIYARQGVKYQ
jgi:hypothetical protein